MVITMKEAIQLILDFNYGCPGYWKDIPIEDPVVRRFIEEGYTMLDEEYQEKYVLNDKGKDFLYPYIDQISATFIGFVKKKGLSCFDVDTIHWFSEMYGLDNETAESLYDYITCILSKYGYKRYRIHQYEHGFGYNFEKID